MPWFVYILFCDQKTYYVGLSHDVKARVFSHQKRLNKATKEFSDIRLVHKEEYGTRIEAETRERQLKGWSVAKKKALIENNIKLLKRLSKNREHVEGSLG